MIILPSSAQAQAQAQLGAEIALFSQLWGTTSPPGIVVLRVFVHDLSMTCLQLVHYSFTTLAEARLSLAQLSPSLF